MRSPRLRSILISLVLAIQAASAQTPAPGKPAGIKVAQHISSYRNIFMGASVIALTLAFALPASSTAGTATTATTS